MKIKDFKIKIGEKTFLGKNITTITGLQTIVAEYEMAKNAVGNGVIVVGSYMPEREIELQARVAKEVADETLRYFKTNKTLVLIVGRRKTNVVVERAEIIRGDSFYTPTYIKLNLVATNPYFFDTSDFGENIAGIVPTFGFPWTATIENGVNFGYRKFTDRTVFSNNGDDVVGAKFKVEATGTVKNFKISNLKTGQFVKVVKELNKGDVLEISTVAEDSYIRLNGKDIFDTIDRMSDFFKLDIGDNLIEYSADEGVTEMNVYMYYSPKYLSGLEDVL